MSSFFISSQDLLVVDGGNIYTQNNAVIYVEGGVLNKNGGTIDNTGTIYTSGDWTNNGGNTFLINNSIGWVDLNGNSQIIKGNSTTDFSNLRLSGTAGSIKTLDINTNVNRTLDLGSNELQTQDYILYVNNPDQNAILWNGGFVSSDYLGGYLVRQTNSNSQYTFPVGNISLADIYRAVHLTPATDSINHYGVRLAAINPGLDITGNSSSGAIGPFDEFALGNLIDYINTGFYHNIYQFSGIDPIDVEIDYFKTDGNFNSIAQWDANSIQWEDIDFVRINSSSGLQLNSPDYSMIKPSITDYNHDVFALMMKDTIIPDDVYIPNTFSPNGDGFNDILFVRGEGVLTLEFKVYNRWGEKVFESTNQTEGWNGTQKGMEVDPGVFVYQLKYTDYQGKQQEIAGNITLIR